MSLRTVCGVALFTVGEARNPFEKMPASLEDAWSYDRSLSSRRSLNVAARIGGAAWWGNYCGPQGDTLSGITAKGTPPMDATDFCCYRHDTWTSCGENCLVAGLPTMPAKSDENLGNCFRWVVDQFAANGEHTVFKKVNGLQIKGGCEDSTHCAKDVMNLNADGSGFFTAPNAGLKLDAYAAAVAKIALEVYDLWRCQEQDVSGNLIFETKREWYWAPCTSWWCSHYYTYKNVQVPDTKFHWSGSYLKWVSSVLWGEDTTSYFQDAENNDEAMDHVADSIIAEVTGAGLNSLKNSILFQNGGRE